MLTGLSTFFRASLAIDPLADIPLEKEFDLHRRYLAIEQMRYPDLAIDFALPDELRAAAVPALILQPLVENAIKHGIAKSPEPTFVRLAARREGERLGIQVANGGDSILAQRVSRPGGIGLANVRGRLEAYYGSAHTMTVVAANEVFEVRITIPLRFLA